ncbi:MAG: carboxymuconolactone decarboxylase family protein [Mycobacteriaceae bacterium]|nr:carboxymuconolactone decarboxylase family protein [Mycobacteriaceae bacterium]MBV9641575.1 carboxymuconolactone decarboxylase family protein [Mycobacteriaceae bacterium]
MPRLDPVPDQDTTLGTKIALLFTKRRFKQLTGRAPAAMLEPLQMYAHIPKLLQGYGRLEQAVAGLDLLDRRHRALAELKAATTTRCEYCIDMGSQVARGWGLKDEELLALPDFRKAACFSEVDKLVLEYAAAMSRTPVEVTDELFAALKRHFDSAQLVELTHVIALENLRARFNLALGIGAAGFSAGAVCARPD